VVEKQGEKTLLFAQGVNSDEKPDEKQENSLNSI
jgi:hypothetical protein